MMTDEIKWSEPMTGAEVKALGLPEGTLVKDKDDFCRPREEWTFGVNHPFYHVPVSCLPKPDADITQLAAEDCAARSSNWQASAFVDDLIDLPNTFRKFREEAHHAAKAVLDGDTSKLKALLLRPKRDEKVWQMARELCARKAAAHRQTSLAKKYRTDDLHHSAAVKSVYDAIMEIKNTGDLKGPDHG